MKKPSNRRKNRIAQDGIVSAIVGRWMAIGMCMGIVVGAVVDNVGLWLSVGLCLGVAVGYAKEESKNKEMSETKKKLKDRSRDND